MSTEDLINRAKRRMSSRSPVRTTLADHWSRIDGALKAGVSRNALYAELKAEGLNVGKGVSSFNAAVAYLRKNPPGLREQVRSLASPATNVSRPAGRPFLGDDRVASDF